MKKILIHDYCGHPFQFELTKKLAEKNILYHLYFKNDYGPKASFQHNLQNLEVCSVGDEIKYNKKNFVDRFFKDLKYGREIKKLIEKIKPDIVISSNCPTLSQIYVLKACEKKNIKFYMWVQDFYSIAVDLLLNKKLGFLSKIISYIFFYFEKKQLKKANKIIIISKEFVDQINNWKINLNKVEYIPNWGNLSHIKKEKNKNQLFISNNFLGKDKFRLLYTGTLALKHDPNIFIHLAKKNPDIEFVIAGIGTGFDHLKSQINLSENIKLLGLQKFELMNDILSIADVCFATLNNDASLFSVPSKILNYLCAGKPILFYGSKKNLASKIILENQCGSVFEYGEVDQLNNYLNNLKYNRKLLEKLSLNSREYAEINFDINKVATKFEKIL